MSTSPKERSDRKFKKNWGMGTPCQAVCGQELSAANPAAFGSLVQNLKDDLTKGTDWKSKSILLMLVESYASNWNLEQRFFNATD